MGEGPLSAISATRWGNTTRRDSPELETWLSLILHLSGMSGSAMMSSIAGVLGYPDLTKGIPRSPVREPILEEAQFTPGEKKHRDPCPRPIKPRHKRHAVWVGAGTLLELQGQESDSRGCPEPKQALRALQTQRYKAWPQRS